MTKQKKKKKQQQQELANYISVPSQIIGTLSSSSLQSLLLLSTDKSSSSSSSSSNHTSRFWKSPKFWVFSLFLFTFLGMFITWFNFESPSYPCHHQQPQFSYGFSTSKLNITEELKTDSEMQFWKQPDGQGYKPCLDFSSQYRKTSVEIVKDRKKYLMIVVSGGMNQQRNQIVDAVVIARIIGATLVVPTLQVNVIWGDDSEFADIFDLDHFKKSLSNDIHIVSSLPSTHLMSRPVEDKRMPPNASPDWIRSHYLRKFRRDGVLLLRGLDSRLSKNLPSDLQKLRCKVAFEALKFAPKILELGTKLADRMRSRGPYLALHLRMEKDVWVRTGCLPGLTPEYDDVIRRERELRPELLTSKTNMTAHERRVSGLCPLNAMEVTRLIKALGAPKDARIYWAGGEPLGGKEALIPLMKEYPNLYSKQEIALDGELDMVKNRASLMAAIDYIVAEKSDVFIASHGGNMAHAIQGHRAYAGHKKFITPNKRQMLPYFLNTSSLLSEEEFNGIMVDLHRQNMGQPEIISTTTEKMVRDVTKFPVGACMCRN